MNSPTPIRLVKTECQNMAEDTVCMIIRHQSIIIRLITNNEFRYLVHSGKAAEYDHIYHSTHNTQTM